MLSSLAQYSSTIRQLQYIVKLTPAKTQLHTDTDTDTLLKIQATNVQESMTIDNTMTHCTPRKINKSYKLKMDQLTKDRFKNIKTALR